MADNGWRLAFLLGGGLVVTTIIGMSQLYFVLQMFYQVAEYPRLSHQVQLLFPFYFLIFTIVFFFRYLLIMVFAFLEAAKVRPQPEAAGDRAAAGGAAQPLVSVLVPAHNEEDVIEATIQSLLRTHYEAVEIIVIDDGSTDATLERAAPFAGRHGERTVYILHKQQGGKASALNAGYRHCHGDLVLSMDADSQLAPDSIGRLLSVLRREGAGICSGQVSIANRVNLLTRLQALEYVLMNGTARMFQSYFRSVLIAPGPIALFSREALEGFMRHRRDAAPAAHGADQGPWESDTFAEDAKLSLGLLADGVASTYEPRARCYTRAPESIEALLNQRYRWIRGNLQAIKRSWASWRRQPEQNPSLGLWLIWFGSEALFWPAIGVTSFVLFLLFLMLTGGFTAAYFWFVLLVLADVTATAFAITTSQQRYGALALVPVYRFFFQPLLDFKALLALFDELVGYRMRW